MTYTCYPLLQIIINLLYLNHFCQNDARENKNMRAILLQKTVWQDELLAKSTFSMLSFKLTFEWKTVRRIDFDFSGGWLFFHFCSSFYFTQKLPKNDLFQLSCSLILIEWVIHGVRMTHFLFTWAYNRTHKCLVFRLQNGW